VGVAIYANGVEDLSSIHEQIGQYPDFIHVDIVDSSFTSNPEAVKAYRMETIKAFWRNREIHTHIMSKTPSRWLSEVLPYSDIVYVHWECDEDIKAVLGTIHKAGKKVGLALTMKTTLDDVKEIFKQIDAILLLTISEPGHSGQEFDMEGLKRIEKLNKLPFRDHLRVCVDGGVNEKIIGLVQVEDVVSGSSVLNHINPKQQILRLQTSGRYEVL
jgi:ribulose-phosphate 3-epimerase